MNTNRQILKFQQPSSVAVSCVVDQLQREGLQVMRTFDLHQTRMLDTNCSCPHHGTDACDCQMVVLLIYGKHSPPVSLVAHGHDGQTWFSLVDTPDVVNTRLENRVRDVISGIEQITQKPEPSESEDIQQFS